MGIITHVLKHYIVTSRTELFSGDKPPLYASIVARQKKTIDHLATGCDRILGHNYTRRHNKVLRCIHLLLMNKYGFKKQRNLEATQSKRSLIIIWLRSESIQGLEPIS
ncbi:hypothetical protein TCON_2503 [Astathelohania contejeani]|uniref:Uncharacterized protein n=1 Tax=Astathelohania contejeani TaxID=164912 RepID=A0ABQ7HVT5_9MICR|nr:hypothetical protein TCON_2503 [Thelohania contejeani]